MRWRSVAMMKPPLGALVERLGVHGKTKVADPPQEFWESEYSALKFSIPNGIALHLKAVEVDVDAVVLGALFRDRRPCER